VIGRSLKGHTHPLYPKLSPNKSTEGAVAGVLANALFASTMVRVFGSHLTFLPKANGGSYDEVLWFHGHVTSVGVLFFVLGVVFGVLGVMGDLLQSLFKRSARLKDTGAVFPGHGGVLDRVDGLLVLYPVAYWTLWFAKTILW
jgi:CDP-diglyceride synthetase